MWGFPDTGQDYLDATVFLYKGENYVEIVDFQHRTSKFGQVTHSGDVVYPSMEIGHQRIDVSIKSFQDDVDTLVFTLSSWNSPNIRKFRNPSLRFYDKRCPGKRLCSDKMKQDVGLFQAIIMCSLSKVQDTWKVYGIKTPSNGNAINYQPLKEKIEKLLQKSTG